MSKARNNIDFLLQKPIAHRGLHNAAKNIPENSFSAFKAAIIKGYPIELDLHLLKDGNVVVFHDDNLNRLTGVDKNLKDCTLTDLPKLKDHSKIPTLQQILDLVAGKVPLLIEFKTDAPKFALERAALPILQSYQGAFAVQSFSPQSLHFFKQNAPTIPRGQLISQTPHQNTILAHYTFKHLDNFYTRPDFIAANVKQLPLNTELPVLAWTIRDQQSVNQAKTCASNLICEQIL